MGNNFNPDAYLAQKSSASGGFDPDAYLSAKAPPSSPESRPGGLWAALTTNDLSGASKLDPLAQGARLGQFADKGNQEYAALIAKYGNRIGNAVEGAIPGSIGKAAGQYVRDTGNIDSTVLSTASKFLLPQNRLGVASYLVEPAMGAYQWMKGPKTGVSKPGVIAKLGQMKTKVAAADIQQAIDDPSVFQSPSVAEANRQYGKAMGPLQGAAKSLRQQTGKTLLGEADWNEAINRPGRILAGTEMETLPPTPVAQNIIRQETPIASRITPKSEISHSASEIVPDRVNVPTTGTKDISTDLRRIVDIVKRARGEGVSAKSIMTDSEKSIYDRFANPIESAATHNVPIHTLVTEGEMTSPVNDFAEKTVLNKGNPIYAGANKYEFGGTINKASYKPGGVIYSPQPGPSPVKMDPQTALEGVQSINRFMRNKVNTAKLDPEQIGELLAQKEQLTQFLEQNGTPGMRAAAKVLRKAHVSENLGRIAPVNKSGGTDVLRSMVAAGEGATAASHALSGNVIGAVPYAFDAVAASPAMLGGAIRNYHSASNPQVMGAASRAMAMSPSLKALLQQRDDQNGF